LARLQSTTGSPRKGCPSDDGPSRPRGVIR
jgi:hypothetical protein